MKRFIVIVLSLFVLASSLVAQSDFISLCNTGTPEQIEEALNSGASVTSRVNDFTPLMYAAAHNSNPEVIVALIKAGAQVNDCVTNIYNHDFWTPLTIALKNKANVGVINALLNGGASVTDRRQDMEGDTPLLLAVGIQSSVDIVNALIQAGSSVNIRDSNAGDTPLLLAVLNDADVEVVKSLIKAGALVNASDNNGLTPLKAAKYKHNSIVVDLLLQSGATK
jgi:ankyrin repeat protein